MSEENRVQHVIDGKHHYVSPGWGSERMDFCERDCPVCRAERAEHRIAELERERDEARKALKPFAAIPLFGIWGGPLTCIAAIYEDGTKSYDHKGAQVSPAAVEAAARAERAEHRIAELEAALRRALGFVVTASERERVCAALGEER